jgi:hypothetical protein
MMSRLKIEKRRGVRENLTGREPSPYLRKATPTIE